MKFRKSKPTPPVEAAPKITKASEYAKLQQIPSPEFKIGDRKFASVTWQGRMSIDSARMDVFSVEDALRFRDWITETFDDDALKGETE